MCQRPEDDVDAASLPVSWSELEHKSPNDPCHCWFTSEDVYPPCCVDDAGYLQSSGVNDGLRATLSRFIPERRGRRGQEDSGPMELADLRTENTTGLR
jgi:hypothetical protein